MRQMHFNEVLFDTQCVVGWMIEVVDSLSFLTVKKHWSRSNSLTAPCFTADVDAAFCLHFTPVHVFLL
jgi:hypothetical protein